MFLFLVILNCFAYLENENFDRFSNLDQMNGYKYSDFKNFEKKWKLITVRYRTDTGELRFTYANSIAYKAMMSGAKDYPDGAIFGKLGFLTEEDPGFTSSKVPSGVRRYQLMVRNKKKHASDQGWGYALFDGQGKTFAEDPHLKIQSCVACHNLVQNRGYVFSQPMNPSDAIKALRPSDQSNLAIGFNFIKVKSKDLAPAIRKHLEGFSEVLVLDGDIRKYIFQGTLDEITPTLITQSRKNNTPTILASVGFDRYTIVIPQKNICGLKNGFNIFQTQLDKNSDGAFKTKLNTICETNKAI